MTIFDQPDTDIPRDRWGRPLVVPPEGGKPVAYTRCTTFIKCLDDREALEKWQQRMVTLGLIERDDLRLAAAAHRDDKRKLNEICRDAMEAAKSSAAATTGTAVHAFTEQVDRGTLEVARVPLDVRADVEAYVRATKPFEPLLIEQFCVLDDYRIGGTPDRGVRYHGRNYIADIKTGSIEYALPSIAMQLAVYARSVQYDHRTKKRTPLPDVDTSKGIVIHLPAGQGVCNLHWVDLDAGWEAVHLAKRVREHRSRKEWAKPLIDVPRLEQAVDPLGDRIATAPSVEALTELWTQNARVWTDAHTELAKARKALLLGGLCA